MNIVEINNTFKTARRTYEQDVKNFILSIIEKELISLNIDIKNGCYDLAMTITEDEALELNDEELKKWDNWHDSIYEIVGNCADKLDELLHDVDPWSEIFYEVCSNNSIIIEIIFDEMEFHFKFNNKCI